MTNKLTIKQAVKNVCWLYTSFPIECIAHKLGQNYQNRQLDKIIRRTAKANNWNWWFIEKEKVGVK